MPDISVTPKDEGQVHSSRFAQHSKDGEMVNIRRDCVVVGVHCADNTLLRPTASIPTVERQSIFDGWATACVGDGHSVARIRYQLGCLLSIGVDSSEIKEVTNTGQVTSGNG